MTLVELSSNYFEIFDLPVSFDINLSDLSERFRHLQSIVHPDKYANKGDAERRLSVQQSALINEAYQSLRNPLKRAMYILHLHGVEMAQDMDTSMDQEFLMQQIELRETLAEISQITEPWSELLEFSQNLEQLMDELYQRLRTLLSPATSSTPEDLQPARDLVRRLQFLSKLQHETQTLEEQLT